MDGKREAQAKRMADAVTPSIEALDPPVSAGETARRLHQSRAQFYRTFRALLEETPGGMRRRLLLERAAWQLSHTRAPVTEIAFDASYASLEAFTRAFGRAFRISPSLYRRMGASETRLPAGNGIHYYSPAGLRPAVDQGRTRMDLYDYFAGAESWHTRRLLEQARMLPAEKLDAPLNNPAKIFPWDSPDQNLRQILERMIVTKEVWAAAVAGTEAPQVDGRPDAERTIDALLDRFEKSERAFEAALQDVRGRNAWGETFIDALCEPAETFSFGGMFAHVITFNGYRRMLAIEALRRHGVAFEGFGCPSEFESTVSKTPA